MERDFQGGTLEAEVTAGRRHRSGRFTCMSMEGRKAHRVARVRRCVDKPERRPRVGQGVRQGSGEERKSEARTLDPSGSSSGSPAKDLGDPPVTVKVREEAGNTRYPATLEDRANPFHRKMKGGHEPRSAQTPGELPVRMTGKPHAEKLSGRRI
jgi:hypothetical protein